MQECYTLVSNQVNNGNITEQGLHSRILSDHRNYHVAGEGFEPSTFGL